MRQIRAYTVSALVLSLALLGCGSSREAPTRTPNMAGGDYNILNLRDINSPDDDRAPFVLPNGEYLLFTTNRAPDPTAEKLDNKSKYGERIFKSEGEDPYWRNPSPYSTDLTKAYNYGEYVLAPGGQHVYFSSSYLDPNIGGTDIYVMERTVGRWGTPVSAFPLNSRWWEAHPAISPDGLMIVFSSNRRDTDPDVSITGYIQPDLWYSLRDGEGNWGLPMRVFEPVNSSFAEISPYYASDGYLYFATNRYEGQGFDIVRSRRTADGWTEPERLPEPINSTSDDVFPFILDGNAGIYFASDRPGGVGGLDLYRSDFPSRVRLRGVVAIEGPGDAFTTSPGVAVVITDVGSNESVTVYTDGKGEYTAPLKRGSEYTVSTSSAVCYNPVPAQRVDVGNPSAFDTTFVRDFSIQRVVFPHFQLERYNIPFFVTGYYFPNTNLNLDILHRRIANGELGPFEGGTTPYIDTKDEDYRSYANQIETIFDTIYTSIADKYLSMFNNCALKDEKLLIEVRGFVDPRGLRPGIYADKDVTTQTMTIRKGESMAGQSGNNKLANLRAYYTMEMIDLELMARSEKYRELKAQGRILLNAHGEGIDTETEGEKMQDPAKRRIDIQLKIVPAN